MISAIREKFGSKIVDIFVWLALISFIGVALLDRSGGPRRDERWALSVNGEKIGYDKFQDAYDQRKKQIDQYRKMGFDDNTLKMLGIDSTDPKEATLDALANEFLLVELADQLNIQFSPKVLGSKLLQEISRQGQAVDLKMLQKYMGEEKLQEAERAISDASKGGLARGALNAGIYIPSFVRKNEYRAEHAFKKYSIVSIEQVKSAAKSVSDKDLKKYFAEQNKESKRYWTKETRSGKVWTFEPKDFGVKVSDKQIKAYYNRHRKEKFIKQKAQMQVRRILFEFDKEKDTDGKMLNEARRKASDVRQKIAAEKGKNFSDLAKQHSDDKLTAKKGGLIEYFSEGDRESAFSKAAFALVKDGELSGLVETGRGIELIQRDAKKIAQYKTIDEVKSQIKKDLTSSQFKKLFSANARGVLYKSHKDSKVLAEFVKNKKAQLKLISSVEMSETNLQTKKLFGLRKPGSKIQYIDGNNGVIVELTKISKAKAKNFESIKSEVTKDFNRDNTVKRLEKEAAKVKKSFDGKVGKDISKKLDAAVKKIGGQDKATVEHTAFISRDTFHKLNGLRDKGLPVDKIWDLKFVGASKIIVEKDKNTPKVFLVVMSEMQKEAKEDFDKKSGQVLYSLAGRYRQNLDREFIASLRKNATIEVNKAQVR